MYTTSARRAAGCACGRVAMATLVFRCACSAVEADLGVARPACVLNCWCHGCVNVVRHNNARFGATHTSASSVPGEPEHTGVAKAFFDLSKVRFKGGRLPDGALGFARNGPGGTNVRSWCVMCGALVNTASGEGFGHLCFRPFNRNAVYVKETGERYEPTKSKEVPNTLAKDAFEPDRVPEPKGKGAMIPVVIFFGSRVLGSKLFGWGKNALKREEAPWQIKSEVGYARRNVRLLLAGELLERLLGEARESLEGGEE